MEREAASLRRPRPKKPNKNVRDTVLVTEIISSLRVDQSMDPHAASYTVFYTKGR